MIECNVGIIRRKTKVICQHMLVTNIHTGDLLIIADVIDDTLLFINSFETATKSDVQPAIISLVDKNGKEYNNLCFSLIHAIVKSQNKKEISIDEVFYENKTFASTYDIPKLMNIHSLLEEEGIIQKIDLEGNLPLYFLSGYIELEKILHQL